MLPCDGSPDRARARRIQRSDWEWIARWFEDDTLARELGPLDEEWLEHVLADTAGVELIIEAPHPATGRPAPLALVGVVWGDSSDQPAHAITDLAIDPARRGYGLGRLAIDATMAWPEHPPARTWIAFVDRANTGALAFFEAIGWTSEGVADGDGMHRFSVQA